MGSALQRCVATPPAPFDAQIDELRQLDDDWDGYGTKAPNPWSLDQASEVVCLMVEKGLHPDKLIPSGKGGVAIYFKDGDRFADFRCSNNRRMLGLMSDSEDDIEVFDIYPGHIDVALEKIQDFLKKRQ